MTDNNTARRDLFGDRHPLHSTNPDGHPASTYGAALPAPPPPTFDETLREQDDSIDELSLGVRSVRKIAARIRSEVVAQNDILDEMNPQTDSAANRMRDTLAHVQPAAESVYNLRTFCMLLWPLVFLILLVLEAFIHFLFPH